jgi:hypothetical protein
MFYLFTSISPNLSGENLDYQKFCIASWRQAGFEVATVNGHGEVSRVSALGLNVEIVPVEQEKKPLIRDILACIDEKKCEFAGIVNADCAVLPYPDLAAKLKEFVSGSLLIAERVDVDSRSLPKPDSCGGFDGFFFDAAILPKNVDVDYRIGVPWWDYYLPMKVAAQGYRIVNLETPLLTHRLHEVGWSVDERERVGQAFWRFLHEWRASGPGKFPAFGPEIDGLWPKSTLTIDELGVVGSACAKWLQDCRSEVPQLLLPPQMQPLETLLRSTRGSLNLMGQQQLGLALKLLGSENGNALLKLRIADMEQRIADMEQSTSWRITKPLRKVRTVLDGLMQRKQPRDLVVRPRKDRSRIYL